MEAISPETETVVALLNESMSCSGDAHLARPLLCGVYPQGRSRELGPYAEEHGQCNEVALGIEGPPSQTSSRVTKQTALDTLKGIKT
jgi:hypothetical protein